MGDGVCRGDIKKNQIYLPCNGVIWSHCKWWDLRYELRRRGYPITDIRGAVTLWEQRSIGGGDVWSKKQHNMGGGAIWFEEQRSVVGF